MFERGRVERAGEASHVPAEITLVNGDVAKGKVMAPSGKGLAEALNGAGGFIEFEPYGGERRFIAKGQVASVQPVGVPRVPNLDIRLVDGVDGFDPHRVLGVAVGSSREGVRAAYVALAKVYHPDRYATAELPDEVREYLATMAQRINAAHAALEQPQKRAAQRAEPIFTSSPR